MFYIATVARVDTPYMEKSGNLINTGEWPPCNCESERLSHYATKPHSGFMTNFKSLCVCCNKQLAEIVPPLALFVSISLST